MNIYTDLKPKNFKLLTIISMIISDLFIITHLLQSFYNKSSFDNIFNSSINILKMQGHNFSKQLSPNFRDEIWLLFIQTLISMLLVYIVIHLICYICFFKNKKFAYSYLKLYCLSSGFFMLLYSVFNLSDFSKSIFLIPALLLLFSGYGTKFFPYSKKME